MSAVTGQHAVVRMMVAVKDGARQKLIDVMAKVGFDIQQHVTTQKLSGQVLNRRTGRLRNSINSRVTTGPSEVSASVGTGVQYAAAHEYGVQRNVVVTVHHRMQTMAWGKPMKNPREVLVNQHVAHMNLPERSFLRSSLQDKKEVEFQRVRAAMNELLAESKK